MSAARTPSFVLPTRSAATEKRSGPFDTTSRTFEPRIASPLAGLAEITILNARWGTKYESFDKVELHYATGLHRTREKDAHVLYFFVESPQVASWYYLGEHVPRTPVGVDRGAKEPEARLMYLIESVEALASAESVAARRAAK
jgi:hypothetical protein